MLTRMNPSPAFDIFRMNRGDVVWIGAAETKSQTILKAKNEMAVRRSSYLILDAETGERTVIAPDQK